MFLATALPPALRCHLNTNPIHYKLLLSVFCPRSKLASSSAACACSSSSLSCFNRHQHDAKSINIATMANQSKNGASSMTFVKTAMANIKAKQSLLLFKKRAFAKAALFRHWLGFLGAVCLTIFLLYNYVKNPTGPNLVRLIAFSFFAFAHQFMYSYYQWLRYKRNHEYHQLKRDLRRKPNPYKIS